MNYYISDTHFGHENIIRLCNRPFSNVEEMNETLIKNWNEKVTNQDTVYFLGDFSFKSKPEDYLNKLSGKKVLISGNHDGSILKNKRGFAKYFEDIVQILEVEDNKDKIILCHYPMVEWNHFFRNSLHFYGHIHNNTKNDTYNIVKNIKNAYNVGADILNFTPQTKEDVIRLNNIFNKEN